jgi:hypothetical protein
MSSFAFLSDIFPDFKGQSCGPTTLFEDFKMPPPKPKHVTTPTIEEDEDLMVRENFGTQISDEQRSRKPEPMPFDSEYYRLLTADWESESPAPAPSSATATATATLKCGAVADHLAKCSECKAKLEMIYRKILGVPLSQPGPTVKMEKFETSSSPSSSPLIDIALLLLLGIVILFVLDCVARLGKYFSR